MNSPPQTSTSSASPESQRSPADAAGPLSKLFSLFFFKVRDYNTSPPICFPCVLGFQCGKSLVFYREVDQKRQNRETQAKPWNSREGDLILLILCNSFILFRGPRGKGPAAPFSSIISYYKNSLPSLISMKNNLCPKMVSTPKLILKEQGALLSNLHQKLWIKIVDSSSVPPAGSREERLCFYLCLMYSIHNWNGNF